MTQNNKSDLFRYKNKCDVYLGSIKEKDSLLNKYFRMKPNFLSESTSTLDPPLLYGQKMKQVQEDKYFGEQISSGGLAESVTATVTKRTGRVLQSIFEIRTMIDDCRSHVTGGIITGLEIWESAVIPYLTSNCDTWVKVPAKTIEALDYLQNLFYRV